MTIEEYGEAATRIIEHAANESWYPAHEELDALMEDALASLPAPWWSAEADRTAVEEALVKVTVVTALLRRRTAEGWTVWHA